MRIVHAADLHVDSPLCGLERYEGAPVDAIRGATRRALENLVGLCLDEEASLLLLAGDLFDGAWKDYGTGLFFAAQMMRLREVGTHVVLVRGNHDAASEITKHLRHPEHVRELSTKKPETLVFEQAGVAVHGQGFASRAVADDLAARYPARRPDLLNIGLLHTSLTGRPLHDPYAPTTTEVLANKGYDYWALGHVHAREVVSESPWIVFPGNVQGRHANEVGAKGATVVDVDGGRVVTVTPRVLDVVRWARCEVDATGAASADEVVERARTAIAEALRDADGRVLCARVTVRGRSRAHDAIATNVERWENELRLAAISAGRDGVWIERVRFETAPEVDIGALGERDDALGELWRSIREARAEGDALEAVRTALAELRKRLPAEAVEGAPELDFDTPEALVALLDDVERTLLPRLLAREDGT